MKRKKPKPRPYLDLGRSKPHIRLKYRETEVKRLPRWRVEVYCEDPASAPHALLRSVPYERCDALFDDMQLFVKTYEWQRLTGDQYPGYEAVFGGIEEICRSS